MLHYAKVQSATLQIQAVSRGFLLRNQLLKNFYEMSELLSDNKDGEEEGKAKSNEELQREVLSMRGAEARMQKREEKRCVGIVVASASYARMLPARNERAL